MKLYIYLRRFLSKSDEGEAWFLLVANNNIWEERNELKKKLLSKKEPELGNLKNYQPIHMAESEKTCSEENSKDIAEKPFNKEIVGLTRDLIAHLSRSQE